MNRYNDPSGQRHRSQQPDRNRQQDFSHQRYSNQQVDRYPQQDYSNPRRGHSEWDRSSQLDDFADDRPFGEHYRDEQTAGRHEGYQQRFQQGSGERQGSYGHTPHRSGYAEPQGQRDRPGGRGQFEGDYDQPGEDFEDGTQHSPQTGGYGRQGGQSQSGRGTGTGGNTRTGHASRTTAFESARGGRSSGQGFSGRGPKGYSRSDERLKEDICERLTDDPDIDASNISIEVSNGHVSLTGQVEERWVKHEVENIVDRCSGVKDIDNRLRVGRSSGDTDPSISGNSGKASGSAEQSGASAGSGAASNGGESRTKQK